MAEGKDLLQVLWSGADVLRGKMDANDLLRQCQKELLFNRTYDVKQDELCYCHCQKIPTQYPYGNVGGRILKSRRFHDRWSF